MRPVFAHIPNAHQIDNDLNLATQTLEEHVQVFEECMKAIAEAGLTLNPAEYFFGREEISFQGMIYGADGVRPDTAKVKALDYITTPTNKEDLLVFYA